MYTRAARFLSCGFLFSLTPGCQINTSGSLPPAPDAAPNAAPDAAPDAGPEPEIFCEADFENITLQPVAPTVELVIDQSGSMSDRFGDTSRWKAMKRALVDPQRGVVSRLDDQIYFGATLFHGRDSRRKNGPCARFHSVAAGPRALEDIDELLANHEPQHGTPTAAAVDEVTRLLRPVHPQSQRIIVLATDGDPDHCEDSDDHDFSAKVMVENAVERAYADGILTYVLSIGSTATREHLRRTANAGQGKPLSTGDAPFFVAQDPDDLADALESLIDESMATCKFTFDIRIDIENIVGGQLELNGDLLEYGADWILLDADTVELVGRTCERAITRGGELRGRFLCE